jgi:large subunit ribosomal protein L15
MGFEGGQMPLQRRVPKFGFTNINRKEFKGINISTLQSLAESRSLKVIDVETLLEAGLIAKKDLVKILGNGKLTSKLDIKAHAFSKSAKAAIEALQGTATII